MKLLNREQSLSLAAAKSGMDEKTARKYRRLGKLPSEMRKERDWRTREDPFEEVWEELRSKLVLNPGLQAKTLFKDLQRRQPGKYQDGQLRTLQRRVKQWRALEGPPKEVFFEQRHEPGELGQSDFTYMNGLGVRIQGEPFDHLLHHFVLAYSNWEWGTVCFTESFESLSEGLQNSLWKLGGSPNAHRTDRMSAAVHQDIHPEVFTRRYESLLAHYGIEGRRIQASQPHENGDVEQRHHRLKQAIDQALMLRGSRDFDSREDYEKFLEGLFEELNSGRRARLQEEVKRLRALPPRRLESYKRITVGVKRLNSTIRADGNIYTVDSRLIGEDVEVRVYADELQVWFAQRHVDTLPRLRGSGKHRIQYRHIIDWLVRKPGAFENYRYREELFPTTRFRMAYDRLRQHFTTARASKDYLRILQYAAHLSESAVDAALGRLLRGGELPTLVAVEALLQLSETPTLEDVHIDEVELAAYDRLLEDEEGVVRC
jgi:hypothetical protein